MMHTEDSSMHRNHLQLCRNVGRRTQSIDCSLGRSLTHQHFESSCVCEHISANSPAVMEPMLGHNSNLSTFNSMEQVRDAGYYDTLYSGYSPYHQFLGYCYPAGGFTGNTYGFTQSFSSPTGFEGGYEPSAIQLPPPPPPAPEQFAPSSPEFYHHACRWQSGPPCNGLAPGRNREMGEHLRVHHHFVGHERDMVHCEWEGCGQTMQRMNVARHIVSRHLLAAANCRFCGRRFSRPDVVGRHERTCNTILATLPPASNSAARI